MKRTLITAAIISVVLLAFLGGWFYALREESNNSLNPPASDNQNIKTEDDMSSDPQPTTFYDSEKGVRVEVTSPTANTTVSSPLNVSGSVPGNWSFEASFPVVLLDANRKVIVQEPATLSGDWMTEELVPFMAMLQFSGVSTKTGYLVLERNNASGLPENDDRVEIPIKFD